MSSEESLTIHLDSSESEESEEYTELDKEYDDEVEESDEFSLDVDSEDDKIDIFDIDSDSDLDVILEQPEFKYADYLDTVEYKPKKTFQELCTCVVSTCTRENCVKAAAIRTVDSDKVPKRKYAKEISILDGRFKTNGAEILGKSQQDAGRVIVHSLTNVTPGAKVVNSLCKDFVSLDWDTHGIDKLAEADVEREIRELAEEIRKSKNDPEKYAVLKEKKSNRLKNKESVIKARSHIMKRDAYKDFVSKLPRKILKQGAVEFSSANFGAHCAVLRNKYFDELWKKAYGFSNHKSFDLGGGIDLEFFISMNPDVYCDSILPDTVVKTSEGEKKYEFINESSWDTVITIDVVEYLAALGYWSKIKAKMEADAEEHQAKLKIYTDNQEEENFDPLDNDLVKALVKGVGKLREVHGFINDSKKGIINGWQLAQALMRIDPDNVEEIPEKYPKIFTDDGKKTYLKAIKRKDRVEAWSWRLLVAAIKASDLQYFNDEVDQLLLRRHKHFKFDKKLFDFNDKFDYKMFKRNSESRRYKTLAEAATAMTRFLRYVPEMECFIKKVIDVNHRKPSIVYAKRKTVEADLKEAYILTDFKGREKTAYNALVYFKSQFIVDGMKFYSQDPDVLSYFHGYKYKNLIKNYDQETIEKMIFNDEDINPEKDYHEEKIANFKTLVEEIICNKDETVYEYLYNWIAFIVQNHTPSKVAVIIQGAQGAGKNTFTDIISEMLAGYSIPNSLNIDSIVGEFNSNAENKKFIVHNEARADKRRFMYVLEALKSFITDLIVPYGEKFVPNYLGDNVGNHVILTNNAIPIFIDAEDRRYLVLLVNDSYVSNHEFWTNIHKDAEDPEFYDTLLTFFMKRDISKFNRFDIPKTAAKQNLIDASKTDIDDFITKYHAELSAGMKPEKVKQKFTLETELGGCLNKEIKYRKFLAELARRCVQGGDLRVHDENGKQTRLYKLTEHESKKYAPN